MAEYLAPGVYVEEVASSVKVIEGVGTSTAGFVGVAERGPVNQATLITSISEFHRVFGKPLDIRQEYYLGHAVEAFFREGGTRCYVVRVVHYDDILDNSTMTTTPATGTFGFVSGTAELSIEAASPGEFGTGISVAVQNSSKFGTTLSTARAMGTFDRVAVSSGEGMTKGTLLWMVRPILATVAGIEAAALGQLSLTYGSLYSDPEGTAVADGETIAAGTLVVTPDFSYMGQTTADVTIAAATDPILRLSNASAGITALLNDLFDTPIPQGTTLWIVPADQQAFAVVDRVETTVVGGNKIVNAVFSGPLTTTVDFPTNTKVLARDYSLYVREEGDLLETHKHLSSVRENGADWAPNRVNEGPGASRLIRLSQDASVVPIVNAGFTALAGSYSDGLSDLSRFDYVGSPMSRTGIYAFDPVNDVNILAIPYPRFTAATDLSSGAASDEALTHVFKALVSYCEQRSYLFCVLDSKPGLSATETLAFRNLIGACNYAAYYYPWLKTQPSGETRDFLLPPSGNIVGIYAFTDQKRGVHKAPAGIDVGRVKAATGIEKQITKAEQDGLNNNGIDVIRSFPDTGLNVWGARTIASDAEWKYINVRRLLSFIEQSIDRGTQWVVFEPNDLALWKKIERNIKDFLRTVWRDGALFGEKEDMAFRVRCNRETNSPETIEAGQVITEIAVAPVKPAEFVIFRISQAAAGAAISE